MASVKIFLTIYFVAMLAVSVSAVAEEKDELDPAFTVYGKDSVPVDDNLAVKDEDNRQQQIESLENDLYAMSTSCSSFCQSGGYGDGIIIGTAPFCAGECSRDCKQGHCAIASSSWSDYGHGCWTGNKICCCAKLLKKMQSASGVSISKAKSATKPKL